MTMYGDVTRNTFTQPDDDYDIPLACLLGKSSTTKKTETSSLMSAVYYHARITRIEAESLVHEENGDFIVRDSISSPGEYVLTARWNNRPMNFQINKIITSNHECVYLFEEERFSRVSDLISFYRSHSRPITEVSECVLLRPIARRSPQSQTKQFLDELQANYASVIRKLPKHATKAMPPSTTTADTSMQRHLSLRPLPVPPTLPHVVHPPNDYRVSTLQRNVVMRNMMSNTRKYGSESHLQHAVNANYNDGSQSARPQRDIHQSIQHLSIGGQKPESMTNLASHPPRDDYDYSSMDYAMMENDLLAINFPDEQRATTSNVNVERAQIADYQRDSAVVMDADYDEYRHQHRPHAPSTSSSDSSGVGSVTSPTTTSSLHPIAYRDIVSLCHVINNAIPAEFAKAITDRDLDILGHDAHDLITATGSKLRRQLTSRSRTLTAFVQLTISSTFSTWLAVAEHLLLTCANHESFIAVMNTLAQHSTRANNAALYQRLRARHRTLLDCTFTPKHDQQPVVMYMTPFCNIVDGTAKSNGSQTAQRLAQVAQWMQHRPARNADDAKFYSDLTTLANEEFQARVCTTLCDRSLLESAF